YVLCTAARITCRRVARRRSAYVFAAQLAPQCERTQPEQNTEHEVMRFEPPGQRATTAGAGAGARTGASASVAATRRRAGAFRPGVADLDAAIHVAVALRHRAPPGDTRAAEFVRHDRRFEREALGVARVAGLHRQAIPRRRQHELRVRL